MPLKPQPSAKLSGSALRQLRALGHALSPVVAIGKDGVTDALVSAVDAAIGTHELVKVKIHREAPVDRHEAGIEVAARTGSVLAQVIGRTLLLYRRHPKKPKIVLSAKRPASREGQKQGTKRSPERPTAEAPAEEVVDGPEDDAPMTGDEAGED
jgi:RNA-binding protein